MELNEGRRTRGGAGRMSRTPQSECRSVDGLWPGPRRSWLVKRGEAVTGAILTVSGLEWQPYANGRNTTFNGG